MSMVRILYNVPLLLDPTCVKLCYMKDSNEGHTICISTDKMEYEILISTIRNRIWVYAGLTRMCSVEYYSSAEDLFKQIETQLIPKSEE